jgi:hypothetical protein
MDSDVTPVSMGLNSFLISSAAAAGAQRVATRAMERYLNIDFMSMIEGWSDGL